jgi:hypothetical protein
MCHIDVKNNKLGTAEESRIRFNLINAFMSAASTKVNSRSLPEPGGAALAFFGASGVLHRAREGFTFPA